MEVKYWPGFMFDRCGDLNFKEKVAMCMAANRVEDPYIYPWIKAEDLVRKLINKQNKQNKMSKKTKVMEFDESIVQLDRESYENLKNMFKSPDKENHVVALSILENLKVKENLAYFLMLYKHFKEVSPDGWKNIVTKVEKVLKAMNAGKLDNTTFLNYWKILYGNVPTADCQLIVDEYADILKGHVTEWGFSFLKHCDWKIIVKDA